jgi:AT hook motif
MYHKISIGKLSANQIRKLLKGHNVRVKHGQAHTIHVSSSQLKKIINAHKKGKGSTIEFDPYQQHHHRHLLGKGEGIWDTLGSVAKEVGKVALPVATDLAGRYAAKKLGVGMSGEGKRKRGRPRKHHAHHAHHAHHGGALMPAGYGFFDDLGKVAVPIATDLAGRYAAKKLGLGMHHKKGKGIHMHLNHDPMEPIVSKPKRGRPRKHGSGIGEDILHGVETVAPFLPLLL